MDRAFDRSGSYDAAFTKLGFPEAGVPRFPLSGFDQPVRANFGFHQESAPGPLSGFSASDPFAPRSYIVDMATKMANDRAAFDKQLAAAFPQGSPTMAGGHPSSLGGDWAGVDQWNGLVAKAASQYGVPVNLIKAIMKLESGGDPQNGSPQGAIGLMQVMPFHFSSGENPWDPATNIDKGVAYLKENYDRFGSWEAAAKAYFGGSPTNTGPDAFGTDTTSYWANVKANWDALNSASGSAGMGYNPTTGQSAWNSIWGGAQAPITQEFGPTDFSQGNSDYDYGADFGVTGHPGVDVGLNVGTTLYAPVSGQVVIAGNSAYYTDERYGPYALGHGELRLKLANGNEVILGHMGQINVQVGQMVQAGQAVGLSGTNNGGHVHVEYRVPDTSLKYGMRIVDPRQYLGGLFSGVAPQQTTGNGYAGGYAGNPMWFYNMNPSQR